MLKGLVLTIFLLSLIQVGRAESRDQFLNISRTLKLHYGVYQAASETKADVLFLHGYGDAFQNHEALYKQMNQQGLRVIGFDFPSHGKTKSYFFSDLDHHNFSDLTDLAIEVIDRTFEENRPLFIVGWSTGGLLGIRLVQKLLPKHILNRVKGLVTYAPGVSVKICVGNNLKCKITNQTLTHDTTLHKRTITPEFPALRIGFASALVINGASSWHDSLSEIPTLVYVGSDNDDHYVKTKEIKRWVKKQRNTFNSSVTAFQCPKAFHELDNELVENGSEQVRADTVQFILSRISGRTFTQSSSLCHSF